MSLALMALSVLAATCYGAFFVAVRAIERGEIAVVTAQRLRVASDVLIRQIKSTVPYPACSEDDEVYPYFVGTATSMTFVTAAGLQGGGGLRRIVYQVIDNPPRLVMSEGQFFTPDGLGGGPVEGASEQSAVLLDGFQNLTFEYLLNDGADIEWQKAWDGYEEELLPVAVRVMVEGLPGMELDVWGQEIPLMAATYGESLGEVDDDDDPGCSERGGDEEGIGEGEGEGEESGVGGGGAGSGSGGMRGFGGDDEGDDE